METTFDSFVDGYSSEKTTRTSTFNPKNYLNVTLAKGETSKELKIRILPISKNSQKFVKIIKMHNIKVPKEISPSGYKSYICLEKVDDIDHEKYGSKCPFCELNRSAYKHYTESTNEIEKERYKQISINNIPNEVAIIRCVERGHEEDGPKFWKINVRKDSSDVYNTIKNLWKTRITESLEEGEDPLNILDVHKGKDFKITITASEEGNKKNIAIMDYGKIKPLSEDPDEIDKLVNDDKRWFDVFTAKSYDYLSILIEGGVPYYDRNADKWVNKEDYNTNKKEEGKNIDNVIENIETKMVSEITSENNDDDEIPF